MYNNSMEVLGKLFGSEARVKILRLFVFNPELIVDLKMVSDKSKVSAKIAKKELALLEDIHLIQKKDFQKIVKRKKRGKAVEVKIKSRGYYLNQSFSYITALRALLTSTKTFEGNEILKRLSKAGRLKLVVIAGVFTQNPDSRLDLFVVGDNLKKASLQNVVRSIEAELGRELAYAYFETPDFQYRLGMYDKLVKDVLDYPHQVLLNKIGL